MSKYKIFVKFKWYKIGQTIMFTFHGWSRFIDISWPSRDWNCFLKTIWQNSRKWVWEIAVFSPGQITQNLVKSVARPTLMLDVLALFVTAHRVRKRIIFMFTQSIFYANPKFLRFIFKTEGGFKSLDLIS